MSFARASTRPGRHACERQGLCRPCSGRRPLPRGACRHGNGCRCARNGPVRPAHPVRSKNDGVRQVSWLTGQCHFGRLLRDLHPQWRIGRTARRLQLQGQPGHSPAFPFDPLAGNLSLERPYPGGVPRARARRLRLPCPTLALVLSCACALWRSAIGPPGQGCPQGLNREVRARGVIPLESGTAPATVTGDAPRQHAIGTARCREGGGRRADSKKSGPGSQETGPQPSILRAGGMYRADGGHARCGALLPADPVFRETTSRTCAQEDRTVMPPCPFRLSDTAPSGRYSCLPA
ncbi:hypothetical protein EDF58_106410 [Novosphingobium sp. PhB57]|nr:hypothetical protein EDF58_106410 [Novosphingobium sp. PhB57]